MRELSAQETKVVADGTTGVPGDGIDRANGSPGQALPGENFPFPTPPAGIQPGFGLLTAAEAKTLRT